MKTHALALAVLLLIHFSTAAAQTDIPVTGLVVTYEFGEQVTIAGAVAPGAEVETIDLQITFPGDPRVLSVPISPGFDGSFRFTHRIADRFIRAFSTVAYEFILTGSDGSIRTAGPFTFYYADNRFDWQTLAADAVTVNWYEGDAAYARGILDAALDGLNRSAAILELASLPAVEIYAYATLEEYRFASGQLGQTWSGGHTDPSTGIVLVSLPPGPEVHLEIERKIPHEVAHIALFQAAGAGFWNLPIWLNEGFASMLETTPNPDYDFLVASQVEAGESIPLVSLCEAFPVDPSGALLAYAEAAAVVRHVERTYGPAGLRALIDAYAAGASCEQGPLVAPIALNLSGLDREWRDRVIAGAIIEPNDRPGLAELAPWIAVMAAVILGPGLVIIGTGLRKGVFHGGK